MKILRSLLSIILLLLTQQAHAAVFFAERLPMSVRHQLIADHDWHSGCPVPLDRLHRLTVSYYDFSGHEKTGHIVVFDAAAPYILVAFKKIYRMHYPLEEMGITGSEKTTGFNCRAVIGEKKYSLHAYGLALDINISRNPYVGAFDQDDAGRIIGQLVPSTARSYSYLNRAVQRPGMNEKIVKLMAESGLSVWGGQWQDRVDYQHFQVPNNIAFHLAYLDKRSATELMGLVARYPDSALKMSVDMKWRYLYDLYPSNFMRVLSDYFPLLKIQEEGVVFNAVHQKLASFSPR